MRLASCLLAFAAFASPLIVLSTPSAAQQTTNHLPSCDGSYNIVRISEIKPGMFQKFLDAVAAQQAWYKNIGTPDQISVMRIIDRNPDTKTASYSTTQAMTSHIEPANRTPPSHDAGYDAFVTLFKESSTIKTEYFTCIVK